MYPPETVDMHTPEIKFESLLSEIWSNKGQNRTRDFARMPLPWVHFFG
jgi:hypothetical protein